MTHIRIEGNRIGSGQKHCVIVSKFNEFITESLLKGALDAYRQHGIAESDVTVIYVPGAYELPATVSKVLSSKKFSFSAITCLGAVIRGATSHYDLVAGEAAKVGNLAIGAQIPVIFGVLTTETIEQAVERAGTKAGNKGYEAATTAIEMANLFRELG
ncbi:6,7-dimethyl-8-ribityllumazine synthase [Leptospira kobayashii]|uniref:6,7-dimethyl-8-ribityllumazine synthase n=1 Tax=Leptospira kobayashii TaxID=1917830 RepID=A0ABM7UKB9_9LEPT|nr:6,7-dimethyl-8-ribityllumazine synthase [Leptospira kobayashii]BDA79361.1 6,7-dimethyl-8-ribityllumazine synthase [Leptospira kobayashii]